MKEIKIGVKVDGNKQVAVWDIKGFENFTKIDCVYYLVGILEQLIREQLDKISTQCFKK